MPEPNPVEEFHKLLLKKYKNIPLSAEEMLTLQSLNKTLRRIYPRVTQEDLDNLEKITALLLEPKP